MAGRAQRGSLGPRGWGATAGQPGTPWLGGHSGAAWDPVAWGATAGRPAILVEAAWEGLRQGAE